uniref:Homeobox protein NANOG-like n=1 Tax=Geotrypetes seraphini TaxID=260995 RepID=A0A6P8PGP2_GEOSA|nr:homeobox protein NANOG-like [Geotrypetes seraphini]
MPVYQTCPGDPTVDYYWSPQDQGSAGQAGSASGHQGGQRSGWPSSSLVLQEVSSPSQGPDSSTAPHAGSPLGQVKVQGERKGKPGKTRTVFSQEQLLCLHQRFQRQRYLTPAQIQELSQEQALSYKQVKTWFQNQRMKQKRCQKGNIWLGKSYWLAQAVEHGDTFSTLSTGYSVPATASGNPQALMVSQSPNYNQQSPYPPQTSYQQYFATSIQHTADTFQPHNYNNPGMEYPHSRQGETYSFSPTPFSTPLSGSSLLYPQQLGTGHYRARGPEEM